MLKKINRGLKRDDLDLLRNEGKLYQSPLFGLSVLKAGEGLKLATIVSKKISKKAVERNKVRRLLMEASRKNLEILKNLNLRMVFLGKKVLLDKKFDEVNAEVKKIFEMIKNNEKNNFENNKVL